MIKLVYVITRRADLSAEAFHDYWLTRHGPLVAALSSLDQLKLAARLAIGRGPPGARTDWVGIAIELLPPRLRDHMTDRYIGAL